MNDTMYVRAIQPGDHEEWLRMRCALWPEVARATLDDEIRDFGADETIWELPSAVFVADRGDGRLGGFVEVSLRPLADGCASSPVGYIEAWYVDPDLRRRGLGAQLIAQAEKWAREHGCAEMASDCITENRASFAAHTALGYQPTEPLVLFRKCFDTAPETNRIQRDWVGIVPHPLSVASAVKLVTDASAGGIDVFLGTTRRERNAAGHELEALEYEAYEEMAIKQLRDLVVRVRERYPIVKLVLLHRVGRVDIGEPSVLIAVAAAHRGAAFDACRWLIDTLKAEVAIWKKEVWEGGGETWVHPTKAVMK
ncbi:MAG TPA: GNAT family N-acetyltransferase [Tepidisphaeraceae bacterium]